MEQKKETLLEIHNLSVSFRMYDHVFEKKHLHEITDLNLTLNPG